MQFCPALQKADEYFCLSWTSISAGKISVGKDEMEESTHSTIDKDEEKGTKRSPPKWALSIVTCGCVGEIKVKLALARISYVPIRLFSVA